MVCTEEEEHMKNFCVINAESVENIKKIQLISFIYLHY